MHFADLHIGMENYGRLDPTTGTSSRVRDFLDRLDEVIDYALGHEADLVVFAGDAFKNRDPEPTQQREFARRVRRLAEAVPTLLLVGDRDVPGLASKASSVDIFHALQVPGVIVGHEPDGCVLETRRGPVFLAWMPFPTRDRFLKAEGKRSKTLDALDADLREAAISALKALARKAAEQDMPRLLVGHFRLEGAEPGSERRISLGHDVALPADSLGGSTWDYVGLGHIHRYQVQRLAGGPPLVYSGSLERMGYAEESEPKGFCWVELLRGDTSWTFVPASARPFRTLQLDLRESEDPTEAALSALEGEPVEGAVVRLQIRLRVEQQGLLHEGELRAALRSAESVTVERRVSHERRARLTDGEPFSGAQTLTPLELLQRYFEARGETPERVAALCAAAAEVLRLD